ncbi:hypothetical protein EGW08_008966 [Elysia chlorotica]|uniref:Major facilitator superfamily (MFS) profile domain-containing protein n=1 Tax=Elysia chlorotica TaxID=188477 RepID=A0A3S1A5K5_ELYCH|nr:hypothetical protein EGW08_008966 [Elysia chlorotica]
MTKSYSSKDKERGTVMGDSNPSSPNPQREWSKDSAYYKRNELPVDRDWAWVICFAGFVMSFYFGLANQAMAILFLEVIELFDTTLTTASLIFLFFVLGAGLMSAISTNIFVPRIGEKRVICITGFIFSGASIGFYLSPNIETFLCCSCVKGLCMGAMFVPSISLLRHYFHRRRSIAQILARAGASAAGIVMPPLVRAIRHEYGIRSTFLIVAALELHIVMAGLLLRPVEAYRFKPDLPPLPNKVRKLKKKERDKTGAEEVLDNASEMNGTSKTSASCKHNHQQKQQQQQQQQQQSYRDMEGGLNGNSERKQSLVDTDEDKHQMSFEENPKTVAGLKSDTDSNPGYPTTDIVRQTGKNNSLDENENGIAFQTKSQSLRKASGSSETHDGGYKANGVHKSIVEERLVLLSLPEVSSNGLKNKQGSAKHIRSQSGAHALSSTLSLTSVGLPEESVVAPSLGDSDEDEESEEKPSPGCGTYHFFSLWAFRMVLLFGGIGAGNIYIKNYVPTIAVSQGASLDQAAMLLTLIGVLDLISRLSLGLFADTHLLKPSQIVAFSHLVLGLLCQLVRFFDTFPSLVVMSSVIGIFIGTRISMMPLICIEVVGVDMMPQAFSIVNTIGTFSAAIMNPSLGALVDSFGNFIPSLHILGVCFFLSATILLLLPLGNRVDKRRGHIYD